MRTGLCHVGLRLRTTVWRPRVQHRPPVLATLPIATRASKTAQQMEATFAVIDQLEAYVDQVGEGMRRLEHRVEATEEVVTGGASVQSKALSFFGLKTGPSRDPVLDQPVDYVPNPKPLFDRLHNESS